MAPPASWVARAGVALARRPGLWPVAARQALVLAAPGWWRRRPFLPLPAPAYLRFRLQAAYGGAGDEWPPPGDLVTYLAWCRSARAWGRRRGPAGPPRRLGRSDGDNAETAAVTPR